MIIFMVKLERKGRKDANFSEKLEIIWKSMTTSCL